MTNEINSAAAAENPTDVTNIPLNIRAETFASGMNSALKRTVSPDVFSHDLGLSLRVMPTWKPPRRQKIETNGFVLPEAFDFMPPKPVKEDKPEKLKSIKPPSLLEDQHDPTDGKELAVNGELSLIHI